MNTRAAISGIDRRLKDLINPSDNAFATQLDRDQCLASAAPYAPGAPSAAILKRASTVEAILSKIKQANAGTADRNRTVLLFDRA